jgi:hypothetical protein
VGGFALMGLAAPLYGLAEPRSIGVWGSRDNPNKARTLLCAPQHPSVFHHPHHVPTSQTWPVAT